MMVLIKLMAFLLQKLLYYQETAKIALDILGGRDKNFKLLSYSILMRALQNEPKELYIIFCSKNIPSPPFHEVSFVSKYLLKSGNLSSVAFYSFLIFFENMYINILL